MYAEELFAEKISERLANRDLPKYPENLYAPIDYILNLSGKRIRPLLVLLGADLFGADNLDDAMPASLAIEYFHNFSLIHDDIMDKAPLRRGKQTIHQKWNDSVAILSGDALLVKAYEQLAQCPTHLIPDLLRVFNRIALEVCEGQQLDMDFEELDHIQEKEYIQMIRLKTSVLLGGALEMGAIIAGATREERERVYNFGVNLGIAFQLQDDILDAFGEVESFGKQIGGDIIVNKKTILHILLRDALQAEDNLYFRQLLELKDNETDQKIVAMKDLYTRYAIREKADSIKQHYTQSAYRNLEEVQVDSSRKTALFKLADKLMHRKQ